MPLNLPHNKTIPGNTGVLRAVFSLEPGHEWDDFKPDLIFSFFSLRFSLIVLLAFFFCSRLPLSRFPLSPILNLPISKLIILPSLP